MLNMLLCICSCMSAWREKACKGTTFFWYTQVFLCFFLLNRIKFYVCGRRWAGYASYLLGIETVQLLYLVMSKLSIKLGDITFRAVFFILIFAYVAAKCICFCIKHAGRVVFAVLPAWVFFEESFRVPKNRLLLIVRAHWAR